MLRSLYVMLDYHVSATDGEQGRVQDFFFDDESWVVHYLVVETASPTGEKEGPDPSLRGRTAGLGLKRLPVLPHLRTFEPVRRSRPTCPSRGNTNPA